MPWAGRATAGASGDSGWGGSGSGAASRHMLAPTVWATSWNTDLSKLSQPEGNLEGGDRSSHWQESAPRETDQPLSWQGHALEVWLHAQSALLGSAPGLQVGRAQMLHHSLDWEGHFQWSFSEAVRVFGGRGSAERSQLLGATSCLLLSCCKQQGWIHVLFSTCGFGRDEVMMGPCSTV